MSKKLDKKEVWAYINNLGYSILDTDYKSVDAKLTIIDDVGYKYYISFYNFKNNFNKDTCHNRFVKSNPYTIYNINLWCKVNHKAFILLSTKYIRSDKKLEWQCLKNNCKEKFLACWNDIYSGEGCSYCRGLKVGKSNCLATNHPELLKEWDFEKNKDITPYNVTSGSHKSVCWKCLKCNYEWEAEIHNRVNNKTGCPNCDSYKGEIKISDWLNKQSLYFMPQYQFNDLRGVHNGLLSYDFYLPKCNLLIEYQGVQHDHPIDFNGEGIEKAKENFMIQQEHDKRKRQYAKNHNINILEIWYWNYDNTEIILNKTILKGGEICN